MTDIYFSDWENNDIDFISGDIRVNKDASDQTASILHTHSVCNIYKPEWGLGFYEIFPNIPFEEVSSLLRKGTRQVYDDNASYCYLTTKGTGYHDMTIGIEAKYPTE